MTALTEQPKNMNFLTDIQFRFDIQKLPHVSFFIQQVTIPGVTLQTQTIGVPMRSGFGRHTGVVEFSPMTIMFLVDEYLKNWQEIFDWVVSQADEYSPAVLTVLSSSMNPTMELHFQEMFPTDISEITFDSTAGEPTYIQATATFNYTEFTIKNLLNT